MEIPWTVEVLAAQERVALPPPLLVPTLQGRAVGDGELAAAVGQHQPQRAAVHQHPAGVATRNGNGAGASTSSLAEHARPLNTSPPPPVATIASPVRLQVKRAGGRVAENGAGTGGDLSCRPDADPAVDQRAAREVFIGCR